MSSEKKTFEYLNSLGLHDVKPGLRRMEKIMRAEGDPHLFAKTAVIAGTNGKTSVAQMVSEILSSAGFSCGLYTSPHLVRIAERIKIGGEAVEDSVLCDLIEQVRRAAENRNLQLSYFEVLTAAAFIFFRDKRVDFAVLEVGMGGRWDAVNIARPVVSVITNVSIDHVKYLGGTEEKIAAEKSGVITPPAPLVTAAGGAALKVIENACRAKKVPLLKIGDGFSMTEAAGGGFSYNGKCWKIENIRLSSETDFQKINACVALACAEAISHAGFEIPPECAKKAVERSFTEARMEQLRARPLFIIDGAHNPAAARALVEGLEKLHGNKRFVFILAMSADKNHRGFVEAIAKKSSRIILTRTGDPKSATPENLKKFAPGKIKIQIAGSPADALKIALNTGLDCCVTGSLYLAGAMKKLFSLHEFSLKTQKSAHRAEP